MTDKPKANVPSGWEPVTLDDRCAARLIEMNASGELDGMDPWLVAEALVLARAWVNAKAAGAIAPRPEGGLWGLSPDDPNAPDYANGEIGDYA